MLPISTIEKKLKYVFKDKNLLVEAFTHSSYANEKRIRSNEQMEFLGDAVLGLIVSKYLFDHYRSKNEGEYSQAKAMTVSTNSLSQAANELGLPKYLQLGQSQKNTNILAFNRIDANLFEAVLCAIYLDSGMAEATRFVLDNLEDDLMEALTEGNVLNAKSALQEYAHKCKKKLEYAFISQTGPDHNPVFTYQAVLDGKKLAKGSGGSKIVSQMEAAEKSLKMLQSDDNLI
ncbi:MAG TPA: ribonuclease III [Eubacteriales bacterium]|nr:ribonuclease III [Eubacteriales bacterium]